eukprot:m.79835 g.79835  ORF g.79835 m.79835 type:complete len:59 (-) comp14640_c0_seq5:81-257(-)
MATGHAGAIAKAIVFGNTATQLAKASDESHTHSWTVYLRSPCGEVCLCVRGGTTNKKA